ncbi:hypothetical protein C5Y97_24795 [Blastopirellula marina]|uniref:Uncharacterized protein n=1 Tax=Blastopirellula marina TaxID=124 RepID=A0A2S8F7J7_9BACT|nr:hypothetical protein C5Y98_24780 [Blastopirellula marina]PTL41665.1 hypothetical protein C5Y97_24795 [Blastopirellula marina]
MKNLLQHRIERLREGERNRPPSKQPARPSLPFSRMRHEQEGPPRLRAKGPSAWRRERSKHDAVFQKQEMEWFSRIYNEPLGASIKFQRPPACVKARKKA